VGAFCSSLTLNLVVVRYDEQFILVVVGGGGCYITVYKLKVISIREEMNDRLNSGNAWYHSIQNRLSFICRRKM
jgi:hypothetical protein